MEISDLATQLQHYRVKNDLSPQHMASIFKANKYEYLRVEAGIIRLSAKEEERWRDLFAQHKLGPPAHLEWYRSKKWRWVIPILIWVFLNYLLFASTDVNTEVGRKFISDTPYSAMVILGVVFCVFYWWYYPPEWPLRNPRQAMAGFMSFLFNRNFLR